MKPTSKDLSLVNSRLPGTALKAADLEILPFMMFDNQMTDRSTVMSPEMMRGVLRDLNEGRVALNTLHRSSSTLPVGRSIEGRIVQNGDRMELHAKMYVAVRKPDGRPFEEGQDLADRYNMGAVYACSAGVIVGFYQCNICGFDIRDYKNCDHWPGQEYKIDEKTTLKCYATMTGHDITDGVAADCGAYELSAVTAGGVRNASVLTETFGKYDNAVDVKDFKKTAFEGKQISEQVTVYPYTIQQTEEDGTMADEKELLAKYYELVEQKAKAEVSLATLQGQCTQLETVKGSLETKIGEYETRVKELEATLSAKDAEYATGTADLTKKLEEATAAIEQFKKATEDAEACVADLKAFKAAYIATVVEAGTKVEAVTEGYETKPLVELQELATAHATALAKIPHGQHSLDSFSTEAPARKLPDSCFQI